MKPIYKHSSVFVLIFLFCVIAYYFGYTSVLLDSTKVAYFGNTIPQKLDSNFKKLVHMNTTLKSKVIPSNKTTTLLDQKRPVQSKKSCKICVPNDIPILVENRDICKSYKKQPIQLDLFIIIFNQFKSKIKRDAIRNTWLQYSRNNTANIRYTFAFGRLPTDAENTALSVEADIYKDIIQGDFKESYRNLTYKTITMLGWASRHCHNVKYVMKTDDDMWVNIPKLVDRLKNYPLIKTVAGCCILTAGPIRSVTSKWYVSMEEYSRDSYPGFCSGTGYVMDLHTATSIHKVSVNVPFLYLEDVYVALCIEYLGNGFHLQPTPGFHNSKYATNDLCDFHNSVITSHYMSVNAIKDIWKAKC